MRGRPADDDASTVSLDSSQLSRVVRALSARAKAKQPHEADDAGVSLLGLPAVSEDPEFSLLGLPEPVDRTVTSLHSTPGKSPGPTTRLTCAARSAAGHTSPDASDDDDYGQPAEHQNILGIKVPTVVWYASRVLMWFLVGLFSIGCAFAVAFVGLVALHVNVKHHTAETAAAVQVRLEPKNATG